MRDVQCAYLFGPPRFVTREEASVVHDRLCTDLGFDDLTFRYSRSEAPRPESRGFSVVIDRREGSGLFTVTLDNANVQQPLRLLFAFIWPQSLEPTKQLFDAADKGIFMVLPGEWTRVMSEVRLRAQCETRDKNGLGYMLNDLIRTDGHWIDSLGKPLTQASLRLEIEASSPGTTNIENPRRELTIEVLREDIGSLYIEIMSRWAQFPQSSATANLDQIRRIDKLPSAYVDDTFRFLQNTLRGLASTGKDRE